MNLDLKGKKAIVCGSTAGIGKSIALELASMGANITLIARNEEKLRTVVEELESGSGQKHDYIVADFSFPDGLKKRVDNYLRSNGPVNILINNTGGPPAGPAINADISEFKSAFASHLICNHILVQSVVDGMKSSGYGRIVNIISTSVKQPIPNLGVSNTIRGAVANWSKTLANELGQFGITVNNVLPGATETGRLTSIIENKAQKTNSDVDSVSDKLRAEIPLRRFAGPEELAWAVAFLVSPSAGYITGTNLPVDGGRTGCL